MPLPMESFSVPKVNLADKLVEATMKTEGLVPGQTPLRITSETMRGWNTIQGVPVDKTAVKPAGRQNFFFVKPGSEKVVVKRQWQTYFNKPQKHGLSDDSTIADVVRKFDQQEPKNKLKILESNNIDTTMSIREARKVYDLSFLQQVLEEGYA